MRMKMLKIVGLVLAVSLAALSPALNRPDYLEIRFFDIGQGDASWLRLPGGAQVLIDGGPDNLVLQRLGAAQPYFQRSLAYVIVSHYHADHIAGLIEVLKRQTVERLLYAPSPHASYLWNELLSTARDRGVEIVAIENRARIELAPDCRFHLLNPVSLGVPADENNSLVVKLDCLGQEVLWSGDNNIKVEEFIIASGWDVSANILKASHHGSRTANGRPWLAAVNPRWLVIPAGTDNRFGHPHQEVLDRAQELGISLLPTAQSEAGSLIWRLKRPQP